MRIPHLLCIAFGMITTQEKYIYASQSDPREGQRRRVLLANIGDIKEITAVRVISIPQHIQFGIQETRSAFMITILSESRYRCR